MVAQTPSEEIINRRRAALMQARAAKADKKALTDQVAEAAASLEQPIADAAAAIGLRLERETVEIAAQVAASNVDLDRAEIAGGDVTSVVSDAIAAAEYLQTSQKFAPGRLEEQLHAAGPSPNIRPAGILSREEERALQEKNRTEVMQMMSAPSSHRERQLAYYSSSPPIQWYCPVEGTLTQNGVDLVLRVGNIPANRPGQMGLGCIAVAECVLTKEQMHRAMGAMTKQLHHQEIYDPEEHPSMPALPRRAAGIY